MDGKPNRGEIKLRFQIPPALCGRGLSIHFLQPQSAAQVPQFWILAARLFERTQLSKTSNLSGT